MLNFTFQISNVLVVRESVCPYNAVISQFWTNWFTVWEVVCPSYAVICLGSVMFLTCRRTQISLVWYQDWLEKVHPELVLGNRIRIINLPLILLNTSFSRLQFDVAWKGSKKCSLIFLLSRRRVSYLRKYHGKNFLGVERQMVEVLLVHPVIMHKLLLSFTSTLFVKQLHRRFIYCWFLIDEISRISADAHARLYSRYFGVCTVHSKIPVGYFIIQVKYEHSVLDTFEMSRHLLLYILRLSIAKAIAKSAT